MSAEKNKKPPNGHETRRNALNFVSVLPLHKENGSLRKGTFDAASFESECDVMTLKVLPI